MNRLSELNAYRLILTCEHATNRIPGTLTKAFHAAGIDLLSHRAWDPGALTLARFLAYKTKSPLLEGRCSRLVVDLNRPLGHANLFSEITRTLSPKKRQQLVDTLHTPYVSNVKTMATQHGPVLHLSVHSFTPVLNGTPRNTDVALLYDPSRKRERLVADAFLTSLAALEPELRLRRNFPYLGTQASLTAHLRRHLPSTKYLGIEIELCNELHLQPDWPRIRNHILDSLTQLPLKNIRKRGST